MKRFLASISLLILGCDGGSAAPVALGGHSTGGASPKGAGGSAASAGGGGSLSAGGGGSSSMGGAAPGGAPSTGGSTAAGGASAGAAANTGGGGAAPSTLESTPATCNDGIDNDGNGYTDCGDATCCAVVDCTTKPTSYCGRRESSPTACTNKKDDDGDGYIDCGDSNCCGVVDCVKVDPTSYCATHAGGSTCVNPDYPKYCPPKGSYGGGCWESAASCDSIVSCPGHGFQVCDGPLTLDCAKQQCLCSDPAYPHYCPAAGTLAANCWSPGTVCSTITSCGGTPTSCQDASDHVDCATKTCVHTPGTVDPTEAWIVGAYAHEPKTENSVFFDGDWSSYTFAADGTLTHLLGASGNEAGTWKIASNVLTLTAGSGGSYDLTQAVTRNCRILYLDKAVWRDDIVSGCPFGNKALTSEECSFAGTWQSTTSSGGDTSSTSSTDEVFLDVDRFAKRTYSSSHSFCYGDTCHSSFNSSAPQVGTWSVSGGEVYIDGSSQPLSAYSHVDTPACPLRRSQVCLYTRRAASRSRCSNAGANVSSSASLIPIERPSSRHRATARSTSARISLARAFSTLK